MSVKSDNPLKNDDNDIEDDNMSSGELSQKDEAESDPGFESVGVNADKELTCEMYITELLGFFKIFTYDASSKDPRASVALNRVFDFFKRDYQFSTVDNTDAILSKYYPSQIPILQSDKKGRASSIDMSEVKNLLFKAQNARCRQRFPVPVILCNGKYICRSATIAGCAEAYGRELMAMWTDTPENRQKKADFNEEWLNAFYDEFNATEDSGSKLQEGRFADIQLLEQFKIGTIVDLMVEARKIKYFLPVSSSEKIEINSLYGKRFEIASLPYPGCEFFSTYNSNAHSGEGLVFDYHQAMCNAELKIPTIRPNIQPFCINWQDYKEWDLNTVTRNYMLYVLKTFEDSSSGILVHCISGWDRTPLFITLTRLSLWADGLAHQSLNVSEMLYFVLAYDWMLFGHHLSDRLGKCEDILFFCFSYLKELASDEFAIDLLKMGGTPKTCSPVKEGNDNANMQTENGNGILKAEFEMNNGNGRLSPKEALPEADNDANSAKQLAANVLNVPKQQFLFSKNRLSPTLNEISEEKDGNVGEFDDNMRSSPVDIPKRPRSNMSYASSVDSWQMVSGTGSVHSGNEFPLSPDPSNENLRSRREKLLALRKLFIKSYFTVFKDTINFKQQSPLKSVMEQVSEYASPFLKSDS